MIRYLAPLGALSMLAAAAPLAAQVSTPAHDAARPGATAPAAAGPTGAPGMTTPSPLPTGAGEEVVEREAYVREAYVMGTRLGARVRGADAEQAVEAALATARSVESLLSTWRTDTELAGLNAAPAGEAHAVSPELAGVLAELAPWVSATDGAFDPAVGALVDAWDLRGDGRVPSPSALEAARARSGWARVSLDPAAGTVTRETDGVWLDAGGFGKGLALRSAAAELRSRGVTGVLNFGGQLVVVGPAPQPVAVAHASERTEPVAELLVADASVATTSPSERYVEVDGARYGHILDPRTGRPVEAWGSVTVVAEDPLVADLLSTALYVMGPDEALAWAADRPYGVLVQERTGDGVTLRANAALSTWQSAAAAGATGSATGSATAGAAEAAAVPAGMAAAQDTTELARLKRQVEAITRELERMRLGGDVVTEADTSVLGFGPAASKVYKVDRGVSIGGYGEVLYRWFADELESGAASEAQNAWDALRAIVYFGYKFNDKVLFNSEIEIEHADEAYLEFAYLDYRISDALGLRGGLLLSPMGLVNELHEPPVFLGTTRPMVEQSVIPTTWRENGFGVFGGAGDFSYRAYVLNGLNGASTFDGGGLRGGRQKGSKALAEDVAGVVRVDYEGVLGLLLGGSVYYGGSGQGATVTTTAGEEEIQANTLIWEGHASYQARGLDLRALVAGATLDDAVLINELQGLTGAESVGERLGGGYAHAGYDVLRTLDTGHQLLPYVRYEWMNTQQEVPAGYEADPANDRTALLLGAMWKPVPQVAVKGDYQIHSTEAETGRNAFALVLSYLF